MENLIRKILKESENKLLRCVDCDDKTEAYFVKDEIWNSLPKTKRKGSMCLSCLEKRLGRKLKKSDFKKSDIHNYQSWWSSLKESEEDGLEWAKDTVSGQELPFKILGPTKPPPTKKNLFVIETNWMSGDADAYNTEKTTYKEKVLEQFEEFIHACRVYKILSNRRYGYHDWEDLNKILNPFGYCVYQYRGECRGIDVTDLIDRDVFSDGQFPAALESVDIKYYDANGIEHNVILT